MKLIFFSPNATSLLQPLDQGIIKVQHRKLFLRQVISQATFENNDQLATCVSILNVNQGTTMAVISASQSFVKNCFKKAGFETLDLTRYLKNALKKKNCLNFPK